MKKILCGVMLLGLAGCAAHATASSPNYVPPEAISAQSIQPPAPEHSAQWKSEIREIVALQAHATKQDKQRVADEANLRPELLTALLGPGISRDHYPLTYALLDKTGSDCKAIMNQAKSYWHTKRPYLEDKHVKSLIEGPTSGSYPSGHAMCSLVWAEVLGQAAPDKRSVLLDRSFTIGSDRVLAGVHYPEDVAAGRTMGYMIFGALQQSPAYRHDEQAASAELKKPQ